MEDQSKEELGTAKIPEPKETGSKGQQPLTGELILPEKESPLEGLPIVRALDGLAATKPKSLGGEVPAALLVGAFTQMSYDLQTAKRELSETRQELKLSFRELSETKTENAVLLERLTYLPKERFLKNFTITVGMALIPIGIELCRNHFYTLGYIVDGLGILLLLFGWLSQQRAKR